MAETYTDTSLSQLELVKELCRKVSNCHQVNLVLLDFRKAFDKVNHLRLLFKLSTHVIKGKSLKWISSFLWDRTQGVVLEWGGGVHPRYIRGATGLSARHTSLLALHKCSPCKLSVSAKYLLVLIIIDVRFIL